MPKGKEPTTEQVDTSSDKRRASNSSGVNVGIDGTPGFCQFILGSYGGE